MELDAILVPQGAEYTAVVQGLKRAKADLPAISIPVGPSPVKQYLQTASLPLPRSPDRRLRVLLVGLCGSLTPQLRAGDRVLCHTSIPVFANPSESSPAPLAFDRQLSQEIRQTLQRQGDENPLAQVTSLSGDRIICRASEKQRLGDRYGGEIIEMEGFATLDVLSRRQVDVAMLRVVSDGCDRDLPDLNRAVDTAGNLAPLPLAFSMMRRPFGAIALIRGSLTGLKAIESTIFSLLKGYPLKPRHFVQQGAQPDVRA
ncbi:hypothetical protein [Synechococcus sp. PCC 7336]|uniref:5'-methylthioadenosine/S-adenosylhomocysteine nucleosidase family protein n=1 Tax=Synechococcus sp. PCC 7336 TaxID=195250 RepID=UPI0003458365|nr:hypothetical protein [Synechococcus sp. PCC 7336]